MKHYLTTLCLILIATCSFGASQEWNGKDAEKICENCAVVWKKDFLDIPSFIKFKENKGMEVESAMSWIAEKFEIEKDLRFVADQETEDELGYHHIRFQQYKGDVPVEFSTYTLHVYNGKVVSFSGDIYKEVKAPSSIAISGNDAINAAKNHINADLYRWEMADQEEHLKISLMDQSATYTPQPTACIVPENGDVKNPTWRHAYRMKIYAHQPESHREIYIDAENQSVLFEHTLIHTADTAATAVSGYSDTVQMVTDSYNGSFRLSESGRGRGIHTWNMEERTNPSTAVEFLDADNFWNNVNPQLDQYATDAHWGAEMTYDFLAQRLNRNSIDNNGFRLNSYVHYDENWSNASWNGISMRYGDGNNAPYTTLDIAGHEIGHGLTNSTANLIYLNESGALNESFSDILGAALEFFVHGNDGNWAIGEDKGRPIRSMSNPNSYDDPDTYGGRNWLDYQQTNFDNGGVHINSGVQNYWFYLLTEGGSGTNDNGDEFDVTAIGVQDAEQIAFRNLVTYLSRFSEFEDARFFSIQAAIDLYGNCSPQHASTANAWYAVGVGSPFVSGAVGVFEAELASSCQVPFVARFINSSENGLSYTWDFGNGETSTEESPEQIFNETGYYTVSLIVDGGACGSDTLIKEDYIDINELSIPVADQDTVTVESGTRATLIAQGAGNSIRWYSDLESKDVLFEGDEFLTDTLFGSRNYYAESVVSFQSEKVGPTDTTIGEASVSRSDVGTLFDVYSTMDLKSVLVYASRSDEETIGVLDENDNVIHQKTMLIEEGRQRIDLDFEIQPGNNYQLKFLSNLPSMLRLEDNASYPYISPGICAITGNTAPPQQSYFYFFDWDVQLHDCVSERTQVHAQISTGIPSAGAFNGFSIYPNPSSNGFFIEYFTNTEDYLEVKMFNTNGQVIREFDRLDLTEGTKQAFMNTEGIATGIYYLTIESSTERSTQKVVISQD